MKKSIWHKVWGGYLLSGLLATSLLAADPETPYDHALNLSGRFLFTQAYNVLQKARTAGQPDTVQSRYLEAVCLLNVQPRTEGNIEQAYGLFEEISKGDADRETKAAALYYLARIDQVHRYKPDLKKATMEYEKLIQEYPGCRYMEMGVIKLAMYKLYNKVTPFNQKGPLFSEVESMLSKLSLPEYQREFHVMVANACLNFEQPLEQALKHFLAADVKNYPQFRARSVLCIQTGEVARKLGRYDIAADYYQFYLEHFPRDRKQYTVRQYLKEIEVKKGAS